MFTYNFQRKPEIQIGLFFVIFFLWSGVGAWAAETQSAKDIIETQCSNCHKFEGKPESKYNLKGPDLMWAGNKYQPRGWSVG